MIAPSVIFDTASRIPVTQGMPNSRLTITEWLNGAPTSTTTPAAGINSGVQDGSVIGATRISPGSSPRGSPGSVTTRALPVTTPGLPGTPANSSPASAGSAELSR